MAIKRIWRGWTSHRNAGTYQKLLQEVVKPGIEAKNISGYRSLELLRRDLDDEVEFMTIMTFDVLENIVGLQGPDYERAYVPEAAQAVLNRWDETCLHFEVAEE